MSYGVTPQGFNRMLEDDIRGEIVAEIAPLFGVDPSTTDWPNTDSVLSQLIAPFARQLGLVWELAEAAFQGIDPAQAFGTMLDGLLALNNLTRNEAEPTEVLVAISGTEGAVIPATTRLSVLGTAALFQAVAQATITKANLLRFNVQVSSASNIGVEYQVTLNAQAILSGALGGSPTRDTIAYQLQAAINASALVNEAVEAVFYGSAVISLGSVASLTLYRATLDGVQCSYTSDASATNQEIVDGIVQAINSSQENLIAVGLTATTFSLTHRIPGTDWTMVLTANLLVASLTPVGAFAVKSADLKTPFSGDVDARMAIDKLFTPQTYQAVATGPVEAPAGTLTVIDTPQTGLQAVTNFLDGVLGREVEEDDEARIRREETLATGHSHIDAIISAVSKVEGVTTVRVYENIEDTPDAEGRPGHSVEVLVVGGADLAVAEAVWESRAAGITPYGNINADGTVDPDGDGTGVTVKDSNGANQVVHFSRPEERYVFLIATKTLYTEEEFPEDGDEVIRQTLLDYGRTLGIGKDFIVQRFEGKAALVPGVGFVDLQVAVEADPDEATPSYGSANVAVGSRQVLVFDSGRITVS